MKNNKIQKRKANKKRGNHIITTQIEHHAVLHACEALEKEGIKMAEAEVTMIPQNYVELTDEESIKKINVILDRLDEDEDVQKVYHNWDE